MTDYASIDIGIIKNPNEFLKTLQPLRNPAEIQVLCDRLAETVGKRGKVKPVTVTKNLSAYSKLIKVIPADELFEGENAYIHSKADGSLWKRHLYFRFTGIDSADYASVNAVRSEKKIDRLENQILLPVSQYLTTTLELLKSANAWELAVGLIAASGRRPTEILVSGHFSKPKQVSEIFKDGYTVTFTGQAKKRGKEGAYQIPVLVPSNYFLDCFRRFKKMPEATDIQNYVSKLELAGKSIEEIRADLDDKKGNTLRRVVARKYTFFDDLSVSCSVLRACYAALVCERDRPKKTHKLFFVSKVLGHFTESEKELRALLTTLNYERFYLEEAVPYPETHVSKSTQPKEKLMSVKINQADHAIFQEIQKVEGLQNQQATMQLLIKKYSREKELREEIERLKKQLESVKSVKVQPSEEIQKLKEENEMLKKQAVETQPVKEAQESKSNMSKIQKVPQELTNNELWRGKGTGSSEEKLNRVFKAISDYNANVATGDNDRLLCTNPVLRNISGVTPVKITSWITDHKDDLLYEASKYDGMLKPDGEIYEYYNKRLGKEKFESIIDTIKNSLSI